MKNKFGTLAALVLGLYVASISFGSLSYAHRGSDNARHHGGVGHHHGGDAGDGFLAGLIAAFATIWSSLVTSHHAHQYEADTLVQAAALYQLDQTVSPVFAAFAADIAAEMGEQAKDVDSETLNSMIADKILSDAAQRSSN